MRINYTTYDTRRCQDVVHASMSQCNVMMLNNTHYAETVQNMHPYAYAHVLGIYHANVIHISLGMTNYEPRRMEFLWVRWYRQIEPHFVGWDTRQLDRLQLPSIIDENSFGFIDPAEVLRGCHVIPAFADERRFSDGRGLSLYANDSLDWKVYYINQ